MRTQRLGCLSGTGLLAALGTLLIVAAFGFLRGGVLFSPGPLSVQAAGQPLGGVNSHAELARNCAACHPAFWATDTMTDRCLDCHADVLSDSASLHSIMLTGEDPTCRRCHPEHRGAHAQLTLIDTASFPHDATGYALAGHQETASGATAGIPFACSDCHGEDLASFNPTACQDCHDQTGDSFRSAHDPQTGLPVSTNAADPGCLGCHDGWDRYGAEFDHNRLDFGLQGGHAEAACAGCHTGAQTPAELQAAPQECYDCHLEDDAHAGRFGQQCGACHTPEDWEQAEFDHTQTGFSLEGQHAGVECESCHADRVYTGTPRDCYACHAGDDAHEGQYAQDCAACHSAQGWEAVSFDHALSAFPLEGKHQEVACQDCHRDGMYAGTPQACAACHRDDDAHDGEFGQDCAQCHTPADWAQATFDHALSAFPLTGAHQRVACSDCHVPGPEGTVFAGTPQACSACHADPAYHQGLFAGSCDTCHTTSAWRPATFNERHVFPINHGESGPSSCQVCHPTALQTYTCYGCHEHTPARIESEHREEGIRDFQNCVRCHPTGREEEGGERGDD